MQNVFAGSARIVNAGEVTPERFFDLVERFKVTNALATPFTLSLYVNHPRITTADLSSLKIFTLCGSKPQHDDVLTLARYLNGCVMINAYGMTELMGSIAVNLNCAEDESSGLLSEDCQVKIVDENGGRLGVGENGEICIKRFCQFLGYFGDENLTMEAHDEEGFLLSGDLGHFDELGKLHIVDRKKFLFNSCGYRVAPFEIETFLNGLNDVKYCCVVPIPDVETENLPTALIVKTDGAQCSEEDIRDAVASE